jgi:hypothetical protein
MECSVTRWQSKSIQTKKVVQVNRIQTKAAQPPRHAHADAVSFKNV